MSQVLTNWVYPIRWNGISELSKSISNRTNETHISHMFCVSFPTIFSFAWFNWLVLLVNAKCVKNISRHICMPLTCILTLNVYYILLFAIYTNEYTAGI